MNNIKIAENHQQALKLQNSIEGIHGWIHWQSTYVCIDIHCECGEVFNIKGEFAYNIKCPFCGVIYACNAHIELIKILTVSKEEETILNNLKIESENSKHIIANYI